MLFFIFCKKFEKLVATFNWLHPAVDLKRVEEIERGEEIETEGVPQPNKAKAQLEGGWRVTTTALFFGKS